jgi:hypothetical protein
MKRIFLCLIVLCVAAVLVPSLPAQVKLDRITTIDVSATSPHDIYASLSRLLGCELAIAPEIQKPVTMHLENVTVRTALTALSENLECQWSISGNTLRVEQGGSGKPKPAVVVVNPNVFKKVDFGQILKRKTPSSFRFDNATLGSVLDALGKAFDITIGIDESDKARIMTIDLSDRTLPLALNAIHERSGMKKPLNISISLPGSDKKMLLLLSPAKKRQVNQSGAASK